MTFFANDNNTQQDSNIYDIFGDSSNDVIANDQIYEKENNKQELVNNQPININQNDNNTQLVEIKVREYEDKNPDLLLQLQNTIGKRKYNKLTFNEKYLLFRYFLEDIDNKIKDTLFSQNNNKNKSNKFIKSLLEYYRQNITYSGNNLNELDYYYVAPFVFFFNAKILDPTNEKHYTSSMLEMINNRINKKRFKWDETRELNDLEDIKQRIIFYKENYNDIYKNIESSFNTEDFEIMSLSQKCALLRIFIDGILKEKYNSITSKDAQKKLILETNKIYQNISKPNNFSYDWFISVYHRFEDRVVIADLITNYEKQNQQKVMDIINYVGNEQYSNLSLIKKYATLKILLSDTCQNLFNTLNSTESNRDFTTMILDDINEYFEDTFLLSDINEVAEALLKVYNNMLININKEKQQILKEEQAQAQQIQNQQTNIQQQVVQQQIMQQQALQQQMIQQNQPQQSAQQTTQQEIEQQALKQMLIQQQMQQQAQQQKVQQAQAQQIQNQQTNIQQQVAQQQTMQQNVQQQNIQQQQTMQQQNQSQQLQQQNQNFMQALMQQQSQQQVQQSLQQTTQQEIEQQALKQMLIQQQMQQHVQKPQQQAIQQNQSQQQNHGLMQALMQQQMMQQNQPQQQNQDFIQALMQQQMMQQQKIQPQNSGKIDFQLAYPTNDNDIIYFAGYKDDSKEDISLYKMTMGKFKSNQEQFIKNYRILTYKNKDGNIVPALITEKYYNEKCSGSKKICLSMIKETLNELKLSNVPDKISAFKGISTKK